MSDKLTNLLTELEWCETDIVWELQHGEGTYDAQKARLAALQAKRAKLQARINAMAVNAMKGPVC